MLQTYSLSLIVGSMLLLGCNKSTSPVTAPEKAGKADWKTVRLQFTGFTKSKSGAT